MSWMLTDLKTGRVVETFCQDTATKARESGAYKVQTTLEYLEELNRRIKADCTDCTKTCDKSNKQEK